MYRRLAILLSARNRRRRPRYTGEPSISALVDICIDAGCSDEHICAILSLAEDGADNELVRMMAFSHPLFDETRFASVETHLGVAL